MSANVLSGRRTIGEASIETRTVVERLAAVPVGQLVTYTDLTSACGRDVQDEANHILQSARRIAQREQRMVFDVVKDVGLVRLDDASIVKTGERTPTRIRRAARREIRRQAAVTRGKLTALESAFHDGIILQQVLTIHVAGRGMLNQLARSVVKGKVTPGDLVKLIKPRGVAHGVKRLKGK